MSPKFDSDQYNLRAICLKLCTQNLQMCLMKSCPKNFANIKFDSIIPEVIQRLCAKCGANWPIGGTITDVNAFLPLTSTFLRTHS